MMPDWLAWAMFALGVVLTFNAIMCLRHANRVLGEAAAILDEANRLLDETTAELSRNNLGRETTR